MGASRQKPPRPCPPLYGRPVGEGKSEVSGICQWKIVRAPFREGSVGVALKVQSPEIRWHVLKFQA
jgi:hypothetical protein